MRSESKEHVLQIREGWRVDEFAALDQGVEQGGAAGALHTAREEPVLPAHRDDTQLVFRARMPPAELCRVPRRGRRPRRVIESVSLGQAA
jgi:hypothetical protein